MIGCSLFPPPARRHFIESRIPLAVRGGAAGSWLASRRRSLPSQVSHRLRGKHGGARGPAGFPRGGGGLQKGAGSAGSPPRSGRAARSRLRLGWLCG